MLEQGLRLWTIIDEPVLLRPIGGAEVLRDQLAHLADRAKLPNVTVQVVRLCDGGHVGLEGGFSILTYADHPPLGYTERWGEGTWLERGIDVDAARTRWDHLSSIALKVDDSLRYVLAAAKEIT